MKKKLSILFASLFLLGTFFGCAMFQIKPDATQVILIKDGARLAGYELAKKYPQYVPEALATLNVVQEASKSGDKATFINTIFPAAVKELTKNINDPLVVMTLNDVIDIIKVMPTTQTGDTSDAQIALMNIAVQGLIDGIQIAQNAKALNQKMKVTRPLMLKK